MKAGSSISDRRSHRLSPVTARTRLGYDITITKRGQKLATEYRVQPSPHKPAPEEALAVLKATPINLAALYEGGDLFASFAKTWLPCIKTSVWRRTDRQRKDKRYIEAQGHPPLHFLDVVSRGLYFRAYVRTLTN